MVPPDPYETQSDFTRLPELSRTHDAPGDSVECRYYLCWKHINGESTTANPNEVGTSRVDRQNTLKPTEKRLHPNVCNGMITIRENCKRRTAVEAVPRSRFPGIEARKFQSKRHLFASEVRQQGTKNCPLIPNLRSMRGLSDFVIISIWWSYMAVSP
jgi:hypothetical protein